MGVYSLNALVIFLDLEWIRWLTLYFHSLFVPEMCILLTQTRVFCHIFFTITTCLPWRLFLHYVIFIRHCTVFDSFNIVFKFITFKPFQPAKQQVF